VAIDPEIGDGFKERLSMDTRTVRNSFTIRIYDKLAGTQAGKNLFLSPFSIQVALAMTAAGAKGETRLVMADLIGAPENVEEQNPQYAKLLKSLSGDEKRPYQLDTANALWGQQGCHFNPTFQEAIADFYDGALHVVNFRARPDEAVKTINVWVSDKTCGKIRELINSSLIDKDTCLILTNAIYFKGEWEKEFEKSATKEETWFGSKTTAKVPMMHQKGSYLYCENNSFQALDLAYKGSQLSALIVLPRKKDGLAALETQWADGDTYRQVTQRLDHEEAVLVSLPRFKMETEFELSGVLRAMHADLAFSDEADFTGIADEPLKLSKVIHKAFVEVNEQGTEAAAATAETMTLCAGPRGPEPQPKVFNADHPFLFFIRDRKTNAVLFTGRFADPN
jgi:serpin B